MPLLISCILIAAAAFGPARILAQDVRVSAGSPPSPFSQNKQNEPAVTVDPVHTNILVAGSNDEIDQESCNAGDPTTCPFTQGVGVSGVYFSFDSGKTWTQPTYKGLTGRLCTGPAPCNATYGNIGTLPRYYELGLTSDGDPSLAFGPRPGADGKFSWANGSRLYYANLASNASAQRSERAFNGSESIAVSRTDDVIAAASGANSAWMAPVIVSRQNSALFSDKDAVWADNAATSPFFGNVYVCNVAFRSVGKNGSPEPVMFARSTDGGDTWKQQQITAATNNARTGGRQDCAIRTDSKGSVYLFWTGYSKQTDTTVFYLARSVDGGTDFERPRVVTNVSPVGVFDPVSLDNTFDGVAGARTDSYPSVDIANGTPYGTDATDEIVVAWADARAGQNHEKALVSWSKDGGNSFSQPADATLSNDRANFPAVAISPNGKDLYVVYNGYLEPWQLTTGNPRPVRGVVRHAKITASGAPSTFGSLYTGPSADARGASSNDLTSEFLGDYNYAVATRTYMFGVWNDVRNASDCSAIDAYRQSLLATSPGTPPAVQSSCAATFGNSDIYGAAFPTP